LDEVNRNTWRGRKKFPWAATKQGLVANYRVHRHLRLKRPVRIGNVPATNAGWQHDAWRRCRGIQHIDVETPLAEHVDNAAMSQPFVTNADDYGARFASCSCEFRRCRCVIRRFRHRYLAETPGLARGHLHESSGDAGCLRGCRRDPELLVDGFCSTACYRCRDRASGSSPTSYRLGAT